MQMFAFINSQPQVDVFVVKFWAFLPHGGLQ